MEKWQGNARLTSHSVTREKARRGMLGGQKMSRSKLCSSLFPVPTWLVPMCILAALTLCITVLGTQPSWLLPALPLPPLPPSSLLTTLRFLFPAAILFVADFGHSLLPFIRLPSAHTLCVGLACSAFCLCKNKSFICCPETLVTSGLSQCQHLIANKWKSPAMTQQHCVLGGRAWFCLLCTAGLVKGSWFTAVYLRVPSGLQQSSCLGRECIKATRCSWHEYLVSGFP